MDKKPDDEQDSANVVPFTISADDELERQMRDVFAERVKLNKQGDLGDVVKNT